MLNGKEQTLTGLKILVVEDNLINQRIARLTLEKMGATISIANNGKVALETLNINPEFHLVLMDIQMPDMDGFEATSMIRNSTSELRNIPIIALTASATRDERDTFIAAGMDELLLKPYTPEAIAGAILTVIAVKSGR